MERLKRHSRLRHSLTGRWFRNAFGFIMLLLLLLGCLFSFMLRYYYYQSVESALVSRAELYERTLELSEENAALPWSARSRELIAYFTDKDKMELQVLDTDGRVLLSSTGFVPLATSGYPDIAAVTQEDASQSVWRGRIATGEMVMALSVPISSPQGETVGALRYVVSLAPVNKYILMLTALVFVVILLIAFFVLLSGSYFISSIVNPVRQIGRTARRIAGGEYDARLDKPYDDEIGELCDTINFMAGEISTAERMKNEFISSISHELRTPLTAIKGWSETMQSTPEDRELMAQGLTVIGNEAQRLTGLVEELLDFSRMESGRIKLRCEPLDVASVIEEAVFLFRDRAARANIHLEYCETGALPPLCGDAARIKQVFVNLLDNAVKYSRAGDRVRVEAAAMPQGVQVVVSDTGIGIAADSLPKVRQRFYQADPNNPGSGLGLALADEIVSMHGGRMDIESEQDVGTTVTVLLPTEREE